MILPGGEWARSLILFRLSDHRGKTCVYETRSEPGDLVSHGLVEGSFPERMEPILGRSTREELWLEVHKKPEFGLENTGSLVSHSVLWSLCCLCFTFECSIITGFQSGLKILLPVKDVSMIFMESAVFSGCSVP